MTAQILMVDDEPAMRKVLSAALDNAGYSTARAADGQEALALVRALDPDVVITDLRMPRLDGSELLRALRRDFPEIPVIVLTAHGTIDLAVQAVRDGAHDFLTKPFDKDRVLQAVAAALQQARCNREDVQGPFSGRRDLGMAGGSAAMERVRSLIRRVAPTDATVLVTGETGTGKELVAEALHGLSPRSAGPLVRLNCGALPETLVESELFGFEKGAFSGADRSKPGRFEIADGGTLFLDEIGELPASAQVKLLRVMQDGSVDPLGATASRKVSVRLVAATHRNLADLVADGRFREDLLYRLRVIEIALPPLRERREDIEELLDLFLGKHAARFQRTVPRVADGVLEALAAQPWRGNIRELEHAVERAVLLGDGPELSVADFGIAPPPAPASPGVSPLKAATAEAERAVIERALDDTGQNVTRAAEALGLSRRGLQMKMKDLGLRG